MENIRTDAEFAILAQQFANAEDFLRKARPKPTNFAAQGSLADLPHYLLIGPSHSGKTSLITQAGLTLYPVTQLATYPQDESTTFKHCNWWISDKGIFLDIPGSYLTLDKENNTALNWPLFLKLFKKYIKNKSLSGIILTGNVAKLCAPTSPLLDTWLNIRQALVLLNTVLKTNCPLYLVLTHTDQVQGFTEFFSDLGIEESEQLFGIDLNVSSNKAINLTHTFKKLYDNLLQRLGQRALWRLNQEANPSKKKLIQFFPLQLENLKDPLAELIYHLADIASTKRLTLQGVYLTSSLKQGMSLDLFAATLTAIVTTSPDKIMDIAMSPSTIDMPRVLAPGNSYFIKQLFNKICMANSPSYHSKRFWLRRNKMHFTAYTLGTALILTSGSLLAYSMQKQLIQLNTLQIALTEYRFLAAQLPVNSATLNQIVPALNDLQQVTVTLKKLRHTNPFFPEIRQASKTAQQVYQQNLVRYFLPTLNQLLLTQLNSSKNIAKSYSALKTYLMLGEPNHLQSAYIQNWFSRYWQQTYTSNPLWQQQLTLHLTTLLAQPFTPIELDPTVLTKVRSLLNAQPLDQLVFLTLKNQDFGRPVDLLNTLGKTKQPIFMTDGTTVPATYTAQGFKQIYFKTIPTLSSQLTHGDWVLGSITPSIDTVNQQQDTIQQVRALYLQDYVTYWKTLISEELRLTAWSTLKQTQSALDVLTSKHTPWITLLRTIAANVATTNLTSGINNITPDEVQTIRAQLNPLSVPITNWLTQIDSIRNNPLSAIKQNLNDLRDYLASAHNEKLAFLAAQSRFNTANNGQDPISQLWKTAVTLPAPLNRWIGQIADNSWRLLLQQTTLYLDETWRSQVFIEYQANIQNKYPLWKEATQNIDLEQFAHFFAGNGALHNYFKNYLATFIDTSGIQWQPRTLDNRALNIPQAVLTQFERANIIRTMFFDDKDQLSVKFTLTPLAMEPNVIGLNLQINGQTLITRQNSLKGYNFTWPGPNPELGIALKFIDNAGHEASLQQSGAWGLFHILDKTNLQPIKNSGRYDVVFDLDGNAVRYQLTAWKLINPFIPGIIDSFRCSEQVAN